MKKFLCFMLIALIALASFVSCEAEPEHVHDMKKVEAKPATCTEAGYTAHKACENCDYTEGKEVIPATGSHDFSATCSQGHEICAECGTASTEETLDNYVAKQSDWSIVNGKTVLVIKDECGCELIANAAIGSVGPAGGYIFYDCDADNTAEDPDGADDKTSETCGWKYLEGAPTYLKYDADSDKYFIGEGGTVVKPVFGYYSKDATARLSLGLTVKGSTAGLGLGKENTATLLANIDNMYTTYESEHTPKCYNDDSKVLACVAVENASITVGDVVFDDWYVPASGEMIKYIDNIVFKDMPNCPITYEVEDGNVVTKSFMTSTEHTESTTTQKTHYHSVCIYDSDKDNSDAEPNRKNHKTAKGSGLPLLPVRQF